jgi:pimeloyl-ACP methyl ester carboxylesterase
VYYQQVQDKNVAAAWEKIKVPVLVIYGEYDWIMSREDHEEIVRIVNSNTPGKAQLVIIPKMSHNYSLHPTLKDAFNGRNSTYAYQARDAILNWLKNNIRDRNY